MLSMALGSLSGAVSFDMAHPNLYSIKTGQDQAAKDQQQPPSSQQPATDEPQQERGPEHTATVERVLQVGGC